MGLTKLSLGKRTPHTHLDKQFKLQYSDNTFYIFVDKLLTFRQDNLTTFNKWCPQTDNLRNKSIKRIDKNALNPPADT